MHLNKLLAIFFVFIGCQFSPLSSCEEGNEHVALVHKMWALGDAYMLENISEFFDDRILVHSAVMNGEPVELDIEALSAWERQRANAIPGVWEPIDLYAFDDKVAAYCKCTGVHKGCLFGLAATEKSFSFYGMIMFRFSGGKICEVWSSWDRMSLMEQLK